MTEAAPWLTGLAQRAALTSRAARAASRLGIGLYVVEDKEHHVRDDDDDGQVSDERPAS
jgi:hypothetical protein